MPTLWHDESIHRLAHKRHILATKTFKQKKVDQKFNIISQETNLGRYGFKKLLRMEQERSSAQITKRRSLPLGYGKATLTDN